MRAVLCLVGSLLLSSPVSAQTLDPAKTAAIQQEFEQWSANNGGRGIKLVVGNGKTGEQVVFQAGNAAKGKPTSDKTIYRIGGMTKIMAGALTAIAFEEGVMKPSDPISKYLPELKASGLEVVRVQNGKVVTVTPRREYTIQDCLGMKCGFSYSYWGSGTLRSAGSVAPASGLLPLLREDKCAGAFTTAADGKLVRPDDWLLCRKQYPLLSKPGGRSYYGYDYDVIGLALSRAYGKDAATLMKEKIFDKLGMSSAFMSWLPEGQTPKGDVADLFFTAPTADVYQSGTAPAGLTPGTDYWAKDVSNWDADMWNVMGPFAYETSSDANYPGVSGYGEGAMMTLEDFAKFLVAVTNKGQATASSSDRIMCENSWHRFMSPTVRSDEGMGFAPPVTYMEDIGDFSKHTEWRWGFGGNRHGKMKYESDRVPFFNDASEFVGHWQGVFGTMFKFDAESGLYAVGGENTQPWMSGSVQKGAKFVRNNLNKWMARLNLPTKPTKSGSSFNTAAINAAKREMADFSQANGGRGIKMVVGNAFTGEQWSLASGLASKGVPVGATAFRLGGMTKILTGMMVAIAIDEGVIGPHEPISKYIVRFEKTAFTVVGSVDGVTKTFPLKRDFTFYDCLAMKCGFGYAYWGQGRTKEAANVSPSDKVIPPMLDDKCAGAWLTARDGKLVTREDWIQCRLKYPLLTQPGEKSFYGADYDVIGLALSRAYKMNPELLMKKKIFWKLGMNSAMLSWVKQGATPHTKVCDLRFEAPPADFYSSGQSPAGLTPGNQYWASEVTTWSEEHWNVMGKFAYEQGTTADYPGVSGYGDGAIMSFEDFAKFLFTVVNKGVGRNNARIVSEKTWNWFMTPTQERGEGMGFLPSGGFLEQAGPFSKQSLWKWGYASRQKTAVADSKGRPTGTMFDTSEEFTGEWYGEFGTLFKFDAKSGLVVVGGENTMPMGARQKGYEFVRDNLDRWIGNIVQGTTHTSPATTTPAASPASEQIQKEFQAWSDSYGGRGVKLVLGNAKTGEQRVFQAGNAAKGKPTSDKTIYRIGGMTKIMAGLMLNMAVEDGVVKLSDPISKYVPELAKANLEALKTVDGSTAREALDRDFTFWDCLGMKCGFSYAYFGMGSLRTAASVPPMDGLLPDLSSDKCAGALTTANGGKLVRLAAWLACRKKYPLLSQPGGRSYYGYDYDVIGLALSRAYGKDAATLMKEKIFDKLGMSSAFMSWLPEGQTPKGDVADLFFIAPPSNLYTSGSAPAGLVPDANTWAKDVPAWDPELWNVMGTFDVEVGGTSYPGVSGYGEGAMMTLEDFAKFLKMLLNKGMSPSGVRLVGEQTLRATEGKTIEDGEGLGFLPGVEYLPKGLTEAFDFSKDAEWKWGYGGHWGEEGWSGIFGTTFRFNRYTSTYWVGGENTLPNVAGTAHLAKGFLEANVDRWISMLECGTQSAVVVPEPAGGVNPNPAPLGAPEENKVATVDTSILPILIVLTVVLLVIFLVGVYCYKTADVRTSAKHLAMPGEDASITSPIAARDSAFVAGASPPASPVH